MASKATQAEQSLEKAKPAKKSGKGTNQKEDEGLRHFLLGITYQFKLSLIVFAHAYDLKQKDKNFTCTIASEDPDAGKFDDIVYKYRYNRVSNTVYIQAKHKQKASTITEADFIDKDDPSKENFKKRPFALFPYFKSFLELKQLNKLSETDSLNQQNLPIKEYVLTTNASIDPKLIPKASAIESESDTAILESVKREGNVEIESFFTTITESADQQLEHTTCYKFKWQKLKAEHRDWIDILQKASKCSTLAKFLANTIFHQQQLTSSNKIDQFKSAIVSNIVGQAMDLESGTYEINKSFITQTKFGAIFEEEYKKLCGAKTDVCKDVETKGIKIHISIMKDAEKLPNTPLPDDEIKDEDLEQFFGQFIIASNTLNEEALDAKVIEQWETKIVAGPTMDLLRSATASENAYANMTQFVLDWMKPKNGKPIDQNDIEKIYETIIHKIQFIQLQGVTEKRVSELEQSIIKIKPERLINCTIYSQLSHKEPKSKIFYQSSYDTALIAQIVYETLTLLHTNECEYDYLLLDDESFLLLNPILEGIFKYLEQNIVLVVELKKKLDDEIMEEDSIGKNAIEEEKKEKEVQEMIEKLAGNINTEQNKIKKVMLIKKIREREADGKDIFLIRDVTLASFKELCNELKDALYFGTNVQLREITEDEDSLQLLYDIIKEQVLWDLYAN